MTAPLRAETLLLPVVAPAPSPTRRSLLALATATPKGMLGLALLACFTLMAVAGFFIPASALGSGTVEEVLRSPSGRHWLGTDELGRDVLALLVVGSQVSLLVGLAACVISVGIGAAIGIAAGYYGGWIDELLMRLTDVFLVLPWLVLMLILAALLGPSLGNTIIVIGLTGWTGTARIVRAQTMTLKTRAYVERALALGAGDLHIMRYHILPPLFSLVVANSVLVVAVSILSETSLSFLGMGDPLRVSWGAMLYHAFDAGAAALGAHWYLLPPGLCVVLVVMAFTFLGQALDDALNARGSRG
jgi:peptide/nickel transport system permease protein